ncbi:MAG: ComEC/Rec2 family competence protein [Patescibacteria group bacterium]
MIKASLVGFLVGVLARSFFDFGAAFIVTLVTIALISWWSGLMARGRNRQSWFAAAILLFGMAVGVFIFEWKDQSENAAPPESFPSPISLTGLIVSEPDQRDERTQFVFKPDQWPVKILLLAKPYPEFDYGDRVSVSGRLVRPREIGYANYLSVDEIYYQLIYPEISLVASGQGQWLKSALFRFKTELLARLGILVPEPEASLIGGLVFGAKQALGADWTERLHRVGLIHIVVLSGYNLTIVATAVLRLTGFLPARIGLSLAGLMIAGFTLMAGAGAAAVRAAIMAVIGLLARATGRPYLAGRALLVAGGLMIVFNPKTLVFDPGFQLSFLATAGLIYGAPLIERGLHFLPKRFGLRELTTTTVSVQLAVLPWLLYQTGQVSLYVLPANLLVLALVPAAMFFGFLSSLAGFLPTGLTFLGWPVSMVAYFLASYILKIADFFASLPLATFEFGAWPFWLTLLVYLGLLAGFFHLKNKPDNKQNEKLV